MEAISNFALNFLDVKIKVSIWVILFIWLMISGMRQVDKKNKIKSEYYFLIVMAAGLILGTCVIPGPITFQTVVAYGVAHSAGAMAVYKFQKYIFVYIQRFTGGSK